MMYREGAIFVECRRGVWLLSMRGEHDLSTEPSLSAELERAFAARGPVVVDLTQTEFIDSSILRALANAVVNAPDGVRVGVVAPSGREPMRLLRLTGMDTMVRPYETCEAAMAAFAPPAGAASPSTRG